MIVSHDVSDGDPEGRILPDNYRDPRLVLLDEMDDGQYSWSEVGDDGWIGDTTLTQVVLGPIERAARGGVAAGVVLVDAIVYAFSVNRVRRGPGPFKV